MHVVEMIKTIDVVLRKDPTILRQIRHLLASSMPSCVFFPLNMEFCAELGYCGDLIFEVDDGLPLSVWFSLGDSLYS